VIGLRLSDPRPRASSPQRRDAPGFCHVRSPWSWVRGRRRSGTPSPVMVETPRAVSSTAPHPGGRHPMDRDPVITAAAPPGHPSLLPRPPTLRSLVQPGDDSHGDLGSRTGVGRKPEQSFGHRRPGRGAAMFIRLVDATPGIVAGFNPQQRTVGAATYESPAPSSSHPYDQAHGQQHAPQPSYQQSPARNGKASA